MSPEFILDATLVTISALLRAAKAARWADGGDPLVLDANGYAELAANDDELLCGKGAA